MSTTNYNWTPAYPRFLADLNADGHADITGIGADGVWSSIADGAGGFSDPSFRLVAFEANAGWRVADHPRFLVDLTGDGRPDLLGFGDAGAWTALGTGDGSFGEFKFVLAELGLSQGWSAEYPRFLSDLTGDGRPDVVGFGIDGIWVALSTGDGSFQPAALVSGDLAANSGWRVANHPRFVADLTGDGHADLIGFGDDGVWVALGNGDGSFQAAQFALQNLGYNQGWRVENHPRFVADLTGDGHADLIGFGDDGVWVALGNGDGSFQAAQFALQNLGYNQGWRVDDHPRALADVTGDGRPDIVGFGDDGVWVSLSIGDGTFQQARFVLADFGRTSNHDLVVRKEVIRDHRKPSRIKHVFVLMLENRSYDHLLGFAEITGTDIATGKPTSADGLKGTEFNCFSGATYPVVRGAPDITVAPGHDFPDALEQLCGQLAIYPNGGPYPDINSTGFVSSLAHSGYEDNAGEIMRCFAPEHVVILTELAREFAVCDRWFCSMPGPTEPNRYFLHAASSSDYDESPSPAKLVEASNNPFGGIDFEGGNIFDALDDTEVETRIYAGDHFPVVGELEGVSNTFDVRDFDEHFADDLQDSDFDAGFIHIEPKYFAGLSDTIDHDFGTGNSQHPEGGVAAGERLIKKTYEAIRNSPVWESSMLIITYDEHGGFYDHVAPGPAAPTGSKGSEHGFMFDQLGPRVPAVVISPLIAKNTIEHRLLEHCSVIKTVCDLFDVPLLKHARDLRGVCGLLHLAQLSEPRTDTPTTLKDVVVSDIPSPAPAPGGGEVERVHVGGRSIGVDRELASPLWDTQDSMLAATLRVAAIRNMALEPERKSEIAERVTRIKTRAEAATFIKEVEAKLDVPAPH
jgi:phospholipase C